MGTAHTDGISSTEATMVKPLAQPATVAAPIINDLTEEAAKEAWHTYRQAVGGKAFNGDTLPDWDTMLKDERKQNVLAGWRAVANGQANFWRTRLALEERISVDKTLTQCEAPVSEAATPPAVAAPPAGSVSQ